MNVFHYLKNKYDENPLLFRYITGYIAAVFTMVFHAIGKASAQALEGTIPKFQLAALRGIAQGPTYYLLGRATGADFRINRFHVPLLIYFSFLYMVYSAAYICATIYVPLVEMKGILSLFSIITAIIHTKVMFKREIKIVHVIALFVVTLGVLMVVQPSSPFSQLQYHKGNESLILDSNNSIPHISPTQPISIPKPKVNNGRYQIIGFVASALAGVTIGMAFDVNAVLLADLQPLVKVMFFTSIYTFLAVIFSVYLETAVFAFSRYQMLCLLGVSGSALISTYCNILASHNIGGIRVTLVYSLQIIVYLILQDTVMKTIMPGHQNWLEICGVFTLLIGASLTPLKNIIESYKNADSLP